LHAYGSIKKCLCHIRFSKLIPLTKILVTTTIRAITHQINGTYSNGWYDSCAVMIRRLIETLIIKAFETHNIAHVIKNQAGDFLYLSDLISKTLSEPAWNLGRNVR
jgi:NAD-specific glutamate dehydrogenase